MQGGCADERLGIFSGLGLPGCFRQHRRLRSHTGTAAAAHLLRRRLAQSRPVGIFVCPHRVPAAAAVSFLPVSHGQGDRGVAE